MNSTTSAHYVCALEVQEEEHLDWTEPLSGLHCKPQCAEELTGPASACTLTFHHPGPLDPRQLSPLLYSQAVVASDRSEK